MPSFSKKTADAGVRKQENITCDYNREETQSHHVRETVSNLAKHITIKRKDRFPKGLLLTNSPFLLQLLLKF